VPGGYGKDQIDQCGPGSQQTDLEAVSAQAGSKYSHKSNRAACQKAIPGDIGVQVFEISALNLVEGLD